MGNIRNWEKLYEVKGPKSLLDMSAVELAERQKECDTIVLSFGAIENHSSHLPLGADWFQGNALIKCVAEELEAMGHKAIPGFCVPFGVQTNRFERLHLHGNCYISQMTFITLVEEICLSLHESGFRRFILCINHSEDEAALHVAAKDLADNYDIKSIVADWVPPMNDFWPKVLKNKDHQGHGGEDETACVMAVVPELVNTEGAEQYYAPERKSVKMDGLHYYGGAVGVYMPVYKDYSPGYIGNPADAIAEEGFVCLEAYAKWIAKVADKYLFETELDEQD